MEKHTEELISALKALADPVRLRLVALCSQGECAVSELAEVLGQSQPRVSQHLRQLCEAGLLQRFRDGHYVYYRVPIRGERSRERRTMLGLLPVGEPAFDRDFERLRALRAEQAESIQGVDADSSRSLHRALIELTVARPLGDLIDIGCGQGGLLKLLASRANRAVGVDIDADARQRARAELLVAGIANCSLRQGDMYALPFDADEFDTVILDDVVSTAERPQAALSEAERILRPGGRLIVLARNADTDPRALGAELADWCGGRGLRLAAPRLAGDWLLAVATSTSSQTAAA